MLGIKQLYETEDELEQKHLLIEFTDGSMVLMRRDQADVFADEIRTSRTKTVKNADSGN